ncbi:helix-turn-helix domain-containing protein [Porphyromonas gingivalis]|uniref:HTH DNA binding protein n=4 Tax=Viruses TaxID=10239 RepID=A0AAT9JGP9_9CAUD|nr:helix-turn-helix transcriptional regulator [Porphyromonas gingivalis]ATR92762.1 XRE family transcriptional regulator [Porphyromonas gingivalis]ATS10570.1 XRE family transcriptional regulator [Porphyromonas gingivalis]ERJ70645.1 DNA-binding helix-turn-helix protein [Porphyromonas gingivalis F0568]MCE8187137.1 helix-turn-helix transcriptional regulator [Porphyromonas gingivalis]
MAQFNDIRDNIKTLIAVRKVKQESVAQAAGIKQSYMSEILSKKKELHYEKLLLIAKFFDIDIIDLITYPKVYVPRAEDDIPVEAIIQLKVSSDKRDRLLQLVLGEEAVEVISNNLNK